MSPAKARRPPAHAVSLFGPWGVVAIALAVVMACAITIGTDQAGLPRPVGVVAGILVAMLTVGALPSVPTRLAVVGVVGMGGYVVARHARFAGVDGILVLGWALASVVTLILAERVHAAERVPLSAARSPWRGTGRLAVSALVAVLVVGALLAPTVSAAMHQDVRRGQDGDPDRDSTSSSMLSFAPSVDMRGRPRLSDRVVMTVQADRPSFWRGATYDGWDGQIWTRSGSRFPFLVENPEPGGAGSPVVPPPYDPAALHGIENRQTFTLEAPYSQIVFAAPTPVRVISDRPIGQFDDATLVARPEPFGRGSGYTVVSRAPRATAATLRETGSTAPPDAIAAQYGQPAVTTERVRALARTITEPGATPYDKVIAIEAWLGDHTEYSLDAPLPPNDTSDVVDWFVYESRRGWCEQIASTLVVMLREIGIPARLATGFATGSADPITGRYTVRERDAHAWAEVYFPGVGWQGFDPTAAVPLAGEVARSASAFGWMRSHVFWLLAFAALLVAAWLLLPRLVTVVRARHRHVERSWAAAALEELERVGRRHDRPRAMGETPRRYAAALAAQLELADLIVVGEQIDAEAFGGEGERPPDSRERADKVLAAVGGG